MRATVRALTHLCIGFLSCAAAAAGAISCADALHLNPSGTGGDAGATTTGTGTVGCQSAKDCTYPTPVCDPVGNVCVECIATEDCAGDKPGTVCSKGACGCASKTAPTYCAGESPACVDTQTSATDCGGCGHACFGACAAGACTGAWDPTSTEGAPDGRSHHVAIWTGSEMFVWGGLTAGGIATSTGGLYDPAKRTWTPTSLYDAPTPRYDATAVYDPTDQLILVWGGAAGSGDTQVIGDGAVYDVAKKTWHPMSPSGAPSPRAQHTAVWADSATPPSMIVWGGYDGAGNYDDTGALYDPTGDTWTATAAPPPQAPSPRGQHVAVWDSTLQLMYVFGGFGPTGAPPPPPPANGYLGDGYSYAPISGTWTPLAAGALPSARADATATFDPATPGMIVFGGNDGSGPLSTGARFDSASLMWSALQSPPPAPTPVARSGHTMVALNAAMFLFGGEQGANAFLGSGDELEADTGNWLTVLPTAPSPRSHHTAVAGKVGADAVMILWGGDTAAGPTNTGAVFDSSKM